MLDTLAMHRDRRDDRDGEQCREPLVIDDYTAGGGFVEHIQR